MRTRTLQVHLECLGKNKWKEKWKVSQYIHKDIESSSFKGGISRQVSTGYLPMLAILINLIIIYLPANTDEFQGIAGS